MSKPQKIKGKVHRIAPVFYSHNGLRCLYSLELEDNGLVYCSDGSLAMQTGLALTQAGDQVEIQYKESDGVRWIVSFTRASQLRG